jgi:hypothetical protein
VGPLVSTEGSPLHIGCEKREKVSTGRFLELPRPVSSAIRIKASGKSGTEGRIRALLHLRSNHQREVSGKLDCQGFGPLISGIVSSLLRGCVRVEIQIIDRVPIGTSNSD